MAGVPAAGRDRAAVMTEQQIENIRQLRGFAIPWEQVAAAVGASEADCRAGRY